MAKGRGKKSKKTYTVKERKVKMSTELVSAIRDISKTAMKRTIETKMNDVQQNVRTVFGYINDATVVNLLPQLSHGTQEGNRIGNRVNCVKINVKFAVTAYNQAAPTAPVYFDIYIFKTKHRVQVPPSTADMALFLEDGNGASQYVGTVLDGLRSLNDQLFTLCYKKRICVHNTLNTSNYIAASSNLPVQRTFNLPLTKYVKKTWDYNDNTVDVTNDTLYMAIGATLSDGNVLPTATQFGRYDYIVEAFYKDA